VDELWRLLRDPKVSTLAVLILTVIAGFAVILLGYQGVAADVLPPAETPYLVSGSLLGITVVGTALRLLAIHVDRVEAATELDQLASLQREVLAMLEEG
jgi:hypothetical protein